MFSEKAEKFVGESPAGKEDEKYEFPAYDNSCNYRPCRNLYNSKYCGGGGKFSVLEYHYIAGAADSLYHGHWICVRLDRAWLSDHEEIEKKIDGFCIILNVRRGGG